MWRGGANNLELKIFNLSGVVVFEFVYNRSTHCIIQYDRMYDELRPKF